MRYLVGFLGLAILFSSIPLHAKSLNIAFGSCLRQWKPQPVWQGILTSNPDLFIFLGDNVYTDNGPYRFQKEPERIEAAYRELSDVNGYQKLKQKVPILATWDDHDYGRNNSGHEYPYKEISKSFFLDFFEVPKNSPQFKRKGIYTSEIIQSEIGPVQILLLDTRTFRTELVYGDTDINCPSSRLLPNADEDATILGAEQWSWFEDQLKKPVALRVIASSIQVIPEEHCYEKWANFPRERGRLLKLLYSKPETPVVILSGDRHLAEISRLTRNSVGDFIYEITSSGLNSAGAGKNEVNRHRMSQDNIREDNFGFIKISSTEGTPDIRLQVRNIDGNILQEVIVK